MEQSLSGRINMSPSENSALIALNEIHALEQERVAAEEARRLTVLRAERLAREQAAREAHQQAVRRAEAQAKREAEQLALREAKAREERIRLQEAALRARAEQDRILEQERLRLDAKMKVEARRARPVGLYALVGALVVAIGGLGSLGYNKLQQQQVAFDEAQRSQGVIDTLRESELAELRGEFERLSSEQNRLQAEKRELDAKIASVEDEAQRQKLLAERKEVDRKLEVNQRRQSRTKRPKQKPAEKKDGFEILKDPIDPLEGIS